MRFLGVIPARYGSTRLEGKPMLDICGHTMIEWVYRRAKKSNLDEVVVATDDMRIYEEVKRFGGNVILTRGDHLNGTSRIAEVCEKNLDYDVIINIQGDEPLIENEMIDTLVKSFQEEPELLMNTLKYKIDSMEDIENPNVVKVVTDRNGYALYFSRSVIPYPRNMDIKNYYKHVGVYGYKREFVMEYAQMESTPLELAESLEQLRVLENGYRIKVLETDHKITGVDTQEDLEKVREHIKKNGIVL